MFIPLLFDKGFRLGGSRRMSQKFPESVQIGLDTDWDFYGENTQENKDFLINHGFEVVKAKDKSYWDTQLVEIYKKDNIEVLIRKDMNLYSRAFESISENQYVHYLWKSSPFLKGKFNRMKVCEFFNCLFCFELNR